MTNQQKPSKNLMGDIGNVLANFASKKFVVNLAGIGCLTAVVPALPVEYQAQAATLIFLGQLSYTLIQGVIDGIAKYNNNALTKEDITDLLGRLHQEALNITNNLQISAQEPKVEIILPTYPMETLPTPLQRVYTQVPPVEAIVSPTEIIK